MSASAYNSVFILFDHEIFNIKSNKMNSIKFLQNCTCPNSILDDSVSQGSFVHY